MRGAYTGGMAHALHDAGLEPFFDVVYGSSAGAYVGAALVLGDGCGAGRIFHEDMACRAFADPRRLGTRRPVVSLDHLIDVIMVTAKPLPWEQLRDAPVPLRVVATAADDLTPHVLEPRTVAEWRAALRATATIPYLAGPAVELHGRRWIDGSVSEPLPVPRALADGATHVLALLNRTAAPVRRRTARLGRGGPWRSTACGPGWARSPSRATGWRRCWRCSATRRTRPGPGGTCWPSRPPKTPGCAASPPTGPGSSGRRGSATRRCGGPARRTRPPEHAAVGLRRVPELTDNLIE